MKPLPSHSTEPESSLQWIVSGLFWGQLLLAAGLYAVVALSPKLAGVVELRNKWRLAGTQVSELEQQVDELERVVTALDRDPKLIQELARVDLDAVRPGDERMAVEADLTLQSRLKAAQGTSPEMSQSWYEPALNAFATNVSLRRTLLGAAVLLVLTSFTFFHPSQASGFSSGWKMLRQRAAACTQRYRSAA